MKDNKTVIALVGNEGPRKCPSQAPLCASSYCLTLLYSEECYDVDCIEIEATGAHTCFNASLPLTMVTDSETLVIVHLT
jgi:hypothetical protein